MPITPLTYNVVKVLVLAAASATVAFLWAPFLMRTLERLQFWKKKARTKTISGDEADVFNKLHNEREVSVPRAGGVLIWVTTIAIVVCFSLISRLADVWWLKELDFLSRSETWLPVFTLFAASVVGLFDDALEAFGGGRYIGGGMSFKRRFMIVGVIGAIGAWWFFAKLGWSSIYVPFLGNVEVGILYVALFLLTMFASWAGGVVDGVDGLAGGTFLSIFGAFTVIAFAQSKIDLASFGAVILGALFAFLWWNIPPARFYMGETGILGLTTTMAVFTFLTDSLVVLPLIAGILVLEVGSIIIQLISKRVRGTKLWKSTPIHHHFEAIGWPPHQVTMRFWILGIIFAIMGVAIRLAG